MKPNLENLPFMENVMAFNLLKEAVLIMQQDGRILFANCSVATDIEIPFTRQEAD
jgi:hypothetical protein